MKMKHKEKQHVILYCEKVMRDEELLAEKRSIELIANFQGLKKHKLRDLENQEDKQLDVDDIERELLDAVDTLEDELMNIEMLLQDALVQGFTQFHDMSTGILGVMKTKTIEFIKFVNEQAELFSEKLRDLALKEQVLFEERLNAMGDDLPGPEDEEFNDLLTLLGIKEETI